MCMDLTVEQHLDYLDLVLPALEMGIAVRAHGLIVFFPLCHDGYDY